MKPTPADVRAHDTFVKFMQDIAISPVALGAVDNPRCIKLLLEAYENLWLVLNENLVDDTGWSMFQFLRATLSRHLDTETNKPVGLTLDILFTLVTTLLPKKLAEERAWTEDIILSLQEFQTTAKLKELDSYHLVDREEAALEWTTYRMMPTEDVDGAKSSPILEALIGGLWERFIDSNPEDRLFIRHFEGNDYPPFEVMALNDKGQSLHFIYQRGSIGALYEEAEEVVKARTV
jgi:hypothetical protein